MDVLPASTAKTIHLPLHSTRSLGKKLDETLSALDGVQWEWRPLLDAGIVQCKENVWSRAARRQKMFAGRAKPAAESAKDKESSSDEEDEVALAVKISCKNEEAEVRWLRGNDHVLYESFCGMLSRALKK